MLNGLTQHFLFFFDIRALWRSGLSTRVPECQKIKNGWLDQYDSERLGRLFCHSQKNVEMEWLKSLKTVWNDCDYHLGISNE